MLATMSFTVLGKLDSGRILQMSKMRCIVIRWWQTTT